MKGWARWLTVGVCLILSIGVTQFVLLRQPYTAPLPKGLPPLVPLADVPRAEMVVAKNGQATVGKYVVTLSKVIDFGAMKGCDGTGKALSLADIKAAKATHPGSTGMRTMVIIEVSGPGDVILQEEWRTGFKEPRAGSSMGAGSDGRSLTVISSSVIEGEFAKIRISFRASDQVPVAYIACQKQGESNGFRYKMVKGTPRYEVMKTGRVNATFDIEKPADLKGVKLSLEHVDPRVISFDDFGILEDGLLKQGTIYGEAKDGVYGVVMAHRVNTVDFKVPRP